MKISRLTRLFRFQKSNFSRSHERHHCKLSGSIFFLEHGFTLDGYVEEISLGGVLFRPAQTYMVRRFEGTVRVTAGPLVAEGELRNTSAFGYGLQLRQQLTQEKLDEILLSEPKTEPTQFVTLGQGIHA